VRARGDRQHGVMEDDLGEARDRPGEQLLDRRSGRAGDGDRAPVAAHPGEPEDVDLGQRTVVGPAQSSDPALRLLSEDGPPVRALLDLERLLRRRPASPRWRELCVSYI